MRVSMRLYWNYPPCHKWCATIVTAQRIVNAQWQMFSEWGHSDEVCDMMLKDLGLFVNEATRD